ncbi:DNA sulfur modification protein DndD [Pseudomonas aeruginosa]|uniref:DNA sulfur modification protein DndD n=1 Tax=Pseudomonas aeruginosa TaxID=287 RepID=UPI000BB54BD0|nr:DNA sulfur modification protein DndD [Pseudomonas aeruginosa]PBL39225.1 DNA sulfur modification protein DndD [Pseudomonas aeruginosa]PBL55096.1 DNA sulfur modification protein DndD [Pseudomonas aeruginosa]PBM10801.1 DNA sulfur modification protein DndD [Pseudomonas aeruginosa]PBM19557.1 DNA sulfur modification protein DndD [Pseudomonas aeruginosa]PBM24042.1 DNA sulfur modification protein DndD [Pseudomonas aeruginosa]
MIIDSLSVLDFRVFSGLHNFDLVPKLKRGKPAPIVLFGGLNGGGKTTILSALKLALYGRGVLGGGTTISEYHQYLKECIHRAPLAIAQPSRAALELTFRYAQHGVISTYHLKRDWSFDRSERVKEGLTISRDGQELAELSYEQAQSFLNELIPIGVSELFFFDGEKISSLAEETTGGALRDSINKLLGLDIIDRLDSDLSILVRTRAAKGASQERKERIAEANNEYSTIKAKIESAKERLLQLKIEIVETEKVISSFDSQIKARGGAWSSSKQEESLQLEVLIARKKAIEDSLHDLASGLLPLAISRKLASNLLAQMNSEREARNFKELARFIESQESIFAQVMQKNLPQLIGNEDDIKNIYLETFRGTLEKAKDSVSTLHDASDSRIAATKDRLNRALKIDKERANVLSTELDDIDSLIDALGENMARAPDENVLIPLFKEQAAHQEKLGALKALKAAMAEDVKKLLYQLSFVARRLDELHSEALKSAEKGKVFSLAEQARDVLQEFSKQARETKLRELQEQFYSSFNRLARKEDRHLSISVDSTTFEVQLLDESGMVIRKSELSAGEKQIFAISILEALARTSGRSLPVVIDTPLGRLDSVHRRKLVENYFPKTSHQVIILSTDTEIDYSFYEGLKSNISHSYHLVYSPESRSTRVEEGYFWRSKEGV